MRKLSVMTIVLLLFVTLGVITAFLCTVDDQRSAPDTSGNTYAVTAHSESIGWRHVHLRL